MPQEDYAPYQPEDGELILACLHEGYRVHWFMLNQLPDGSPGSEFFTRISDRTGEVTTGLARFACICDECLMIPKLEDAIRHFFRPPFASTGDSQP